MDADKTFYCKRSLFEQVLWRSFIVHGIHMNIYRGLPEPSR